MKRATGLVLTALACAGCATAASWRPTPGAPATFALLLNGGGTPTTNYASHGYHLAGMNEVLQSRGLDRRQISILSGDGDVPAADSAVGYPATATRAWLLDGTVLERPLGHPVRYMNLNIPNASAEPGTRDSLEDWLAQARRGLQPGDTLLLFVTDHGEKGKTPVDSRITLWQRESISARELGERLSRFAPGVRVVTVMSQCYSGGFAQMALHPDGGRKVGDTCGFFATTADRGAWGCYAESTGGDKEEGYAFKFIQGLRRSNSLAAAHAETLLTDRSPDVPLRSSDFYLAGVVERAAARRNTSPDALVSSLMGEALKGRYEEVALVEQLTRSYAIPVDGVLDEQTRHLYDLRNRLNDSADTWSAALGELTQANLDAFLAARPQWQTVMVPRTLARLTARGLPGTQERFVAELRAFAAAEPERMKQLEYGHLRSQAARAAAFRSEVRVAALLRLRALLTTLVGRLLLEREGTAEERANLAALSACEATSLPVAGIKGQVADEPIPFPPISSEDRVALALTPASLGAALGEVPPAARAAGKLPDGAATVVAIDPGSPASAVGLQPGDILLGGPDAPVRERGGMKLFLAAHASGELEIVRGGRRQVLEPAMARSARSFEARDLRAAGRVALGGLAPFRGALGATLDARKPYLLFFWATWCTYCKQAIPELLELERQRGITVLAISDETPDALASFFGLWPGGFPNLVAIDGERRANEAFKVDGYPTFIAVDDKGRVTMRSSGYRPEVGLPLEGWHRSSPGVAGGHH
jgi:thiol-disulfide isomerase/thioredoxin